MLVACSEPHEVEVFATVELPDTRDFPGDLAVRDEADSRCSHAFAEYAPAFVDDPGIEVSYLYPDALAWGAGDRDVTCLAGDPARMRTGSLHS
jgi:hypothetical protein